MNTEDTFDPDALFATRLEQLHKRLRESSGTESDGPPAPLVDSDARLQDAFEALRLIQQVKQDHFDSPQTGSPDRETRRQSDTGLDQDNSTQPIDLRGQLVGRFELIEVIGKGGYGTVFRARDHDVKRDVALKIPRIPLLASPESSTRFTREAKAAGALSHPNIVTIYEAGRDQDVFFIASELVEGDTLAEWLIRSDALPDSEQIARLISTLADAMQHAHSRGVLHRDLKPANVLLDSRAGIVQQTESDSSRLDQPRITDFGLAKFEHDLTEATQTGMIIGTPAYMAPEQTDGTRDSGASADIYSLGAIMYELTTGRKPFVGTTILELIRAVKDEPPIAPRKLCSEIPPDLEAICLKCLEKEPRLRYATAGDLQSDLQRFLKGETVIARPITSADRIVRWVKRNPMIAGSLGAAMFFLIAALVSVTVGWISANSLLARESAALTDAQKRYMETKQAIDTYFMKVEADPVLKNTPGTESLRNDLLAMPLEYYKQYVAENNNDPELKSEIARTEYRIAEILRQLSMYHDARLHYLMAADLVNGQLLRRSNDLALRSLEAQICRGLGSVNLSIGNLDEASRYYLLALKHQQSLFDENPDDISQLWQLAQYNSQFGEVLRKSGKMSEWPEQMKIAQSMFQMAMTLDHLNSDLRLAAIKNKGGLATALRATGNAEQAERMTTETVGELRAMVETNPRLWEAHEVYAVSVIQKSTFAIMRGDFESPVADLKHAHSTMDRLCWLHPGIERYIGKKQGVLARLAIVADRSGDKELAEQSFGDLVNMARDRLNRDDSIVDSKFDLAQHLCNLAMFRLRHRRDPVDVQPLVDEAQLLSRACLVAQPLNDDFRLLRIMVLDILSKLAYDSQDNEKAISKTDIAVKLIEETADPLNRDPRFHQHAYVIYQTRALTNQRLGRFQESVKAWEMMVRHCPSRLKNEGQLRLAVAHIRLGQISESEQVFSKIDLESAKGKDYLYLARYLAMSALNCDHEAQKQTTLELAMKALVQLEDSGYLNSRRRINSLAESADLVALHHEKRFQDFVERLDEEMGPPD